MDRTPLKLAADFRADGRPTNELVRGARVGELHRVRRGAYIDSGRWGEFPPAVRHRFAMEAVHTAARSAPVFSHESAAAVWGIPIVGGWPSTPQVTTTPGSAQRTRNGVKRIQAELAEHEIVYRDGVFVTSPLRTALDLAASRDFLAGMCAVEMVLHELTRFGLIKADLAAALELRRPFRGARAVAAVLDFASALSASVFETLCRVRFRELGYADPEQQIRYIGTAGQTYFADFRFREQDVLVEPDGHVKYEEARYLNGRTPQQALWDEKERGDELRMQCAALVHLSWTDAWERVGLIRKLDRVGIPHARRSR